MEVTPEGNPLLSGFFCFQQRTFMHMPPRDMWRIDPPSFH
jgi:hypothetical protein